MSTNIFQQIWCVYICCKLVDHKNLTWVVFIDLSIINGATFYPVLSDLMGLMKIFFYFPLPLVRRMRVSSVLVSCLMDLMKGCACYVFTTWHASEHLLSFTIWFDGLYECLIWVVYWFGLPPASFSYFIGLSKE